MEEGRLWGTCSWTERSVSRGPTHTESACRGNERAAAFLFTATATVELTTERGTGWLRQETASEERQQKRGKSCLSWCVSHAVSSPQTQRSASICREASEDLVHQEAILITLSVSQQSTTV